MFLRATRRFKDGKVHYYWSVVENVRVGRRVFQRQALYLGERRVVLLCPARALAVGFAVASGDLPSGLRPSAHAPPQPKSNWPRGVDFTHGDLLVTRI